jgi:amidase
MSNFDDLSQLDATEQAAIVRRKEIKPAELLEAAIERIERINPALNAVIRRMYDEARATIDRGLPDGPFTGVPFLLKDLQAAYAGVPMTSGSRFLKDLTPQYDSELVARLKRSGLVIIGKTNTPEFGILPTTEPAFFGATRNPWDTTRTPGGSSGGSAAAVASRMVPMAHANDGGGSIRIPASCCGLFGLKPTRGRNPLGPGFGDMFGGLVAEHAVTISVRDSAALLDATSGPDIGDPYNAPVRERDFLHEASAAPRPLRIGFTISTSTGVPVHDDCIEAVRDAADLCDELGHDVEEAEPLINGREMLRPFMTIWSAGNAWVLDGCSHILGRTPGEDEIEPLSRALAEAGRQHSAPEYLRSIQTMQSMSRRVARFFENFDVWLTPTLAQPPLVLGSFDAPPDEPMRAMAVSGGFAPFTAIANMTGQPAMSVPLFWNSEGLPIGAHFVGRFGDEATLFRLASQLEEARPWAAKNLKRTQETQG